MVPKVGDGKIRDPSDEDDKYKDLSVSCNFCSKEKSNLATFWLLYSLSKGRFGTKSADKQCREWFVSSFCLS